jgi:hypothetical protein
VQRHTNAIRPERLCSVHGNERYVLKAFDGVPLVKAESLLNDYGGKAQAMPERLLVNVRAHFLQARSKRFNLLFAGTCQSFGKPFITPL